MDVNIEAEIEDIFRRKLLGRGMQEINNNHDGAVGNWLESQFGIEANSSNNPDFKGYELKKPTRNKTTFGDWSADRYAFSSDLDLCSREEFMRFFGSPNESGRLSWSGACVPKVSSWNTYGQRLWVSDEGDIFAVYSYARDLRPEKQSVIPAYFQNGNRAIAAWRHESLREKVNNKFNQHGWFSVRINERGLIESLVFGQPFDFDFWIANVRKGKIYLDSGMMDGTNKRPYSNWRANNDFWDALIVRTVR